MFNLVVDEVFRRADSENLISAIVIITRVTAKLNPISPTPLLKILCQLNEDDEDDDGQIQFLFSMIRERLEISLRDCSEHNLLLLSFCMSEIVKITYKSVRDENMDRLSILIDFLVTSLPDMLVLYEDVYINLTELSDVQKLFIPISKSVPELASLANTGTFMLSDEPPTPVAGSGLALLFEMISQYGGDGQTYANRIFQSYFSVFFLSCNTLEQLNNPGETTESDEPYTNTYSGFTPTQQNELLKSRLIIESSAIFDESLPLRVFLKDIATDAIRKKSGEIFLVKRIISIMQKLLEAPHFLNSVEILENMGKAVATLCSLSAFQTTLIDELTTDEKNIVINFCFQNHETIEISKMVQVPIFNCILDHQVEILHEKKSMFTDEKLAELFSSLTCWLADNYTKKVDGNSVTDSTVKLLNALTTSILSKQLIEIGLARIVFDSPDEYFVSLFEYIVKLANALGETDTILGHQKVIQVTKIFLTDLSGKSTQELKPVVENKKLLTLLSYVTQLGLHLDVNKREPSSDLMNTDSVRVGNNFLRKLTV